MVYKEKTEFLNALKSLIGDKEDEGTLEIMTNLEDTFDNARGDLQTRFDELTDKHNKLMKTYKERFFAGEEKKDPPADDKPKVEMTLTNLLKGEKK